MWVGNTFVFIYFFFFQKSQSAFHPLLWNFISSENNPSSFWASNRIHEKQLWSEFLPRGLCVYLVWLTGVGNSGSCGQAQSWLVWKEIRLPATLDPTHTLIRHSWNLLLQHLCRIRKYSAVRLISVKLLKAERETCKLYIRPACDT